MISYLHGSNENVVFHADKASFIVNLCCLVLAAPNAAILLVVVVSMFVVYSTRRISAHFFQHNDQFE